jgi:hypothetical protein
LWKLVRSKSQDRKQSPICGRFSQASITSVAICGGDRIEDIHHLSFRSGEVGTFILAETLEHVLDPLRAMHEIHRCLREGGVVIYSSVMLFPINGIAG